MLSNHDTIRHRTRYGPATRRDALEGSAGVVPTDLELGRRRARAAALLELALPGGAYIYQGDELSLPEVEDLPEDVLDDPTWERSGHTVRGRDGCRVPIPWSGRAAVRLRSRHQPALAPPAGRLVRPDRRGAGAQPDSHLNLYRSALRIRREHPALGEGRLAWDQDAAPGVLSFTRDPGFRCVVNFGPGPYEIPETAEVLVSSGLSGPRSVGIDEAVWLRA